MAAAKVSERRHHPLKMPLRIDLVTGRAICRFHNYDARHGCKKFKECPLIHDTCHVCLEKGTHLAHECKHYNNPNSSIWQHFCSLTLKNTRPADYPSHKTVLGDTILWIGDTASVTSMEDTEPKTIHIPPPNLDGFQPGQDDLLGRCRKQKRIEAKCVLQLAPGAVVVDVGAHLGDTVLTLALYARSHHRSDLKFVALEPCPEKCKFLRTVIACNGLQDKIQVMCCAVGDTTGRTVQPASNAKDRARREGSLRYEYCGSENNDDEAAIPMITLDSIIDRLLPIGLLHIDVEGWEANVLRGAKKLLTTVPTRNDDNNNTSTFPCFIIAEAWTEKECVRRGVSGDAEERIVSVMEEELCNFNGEDDCKEKCFEFHRLNDIVDVERNLVYVRRQKKNGDKQ